MKTKSPNTKHYVMVFFPGFAMSNQSTLEIKDRAPESVPLTSTCFAFRFFDVTEFEFEGELLKGEPKNNSGTYFIDGTVVSVAEAIKNHSANASNLSNLRPNELIVKCKHANWQWFDPEKDHIYSTKEGKVIE